MIESSREFRSTEPELGRLIRLYAQTDGVHPTAVPGLFMIRESTVSEPIARVNEVSFCLIAQGEKEVWLGEQSFRYGPGNYIVASVELPVTGQVMLASPDFPYLALKLEFSPTEVLEALSGTDAQPVLGRNARRAMFIGEAEKPLLDASIRLASLLDEPRHASALAPLCKKEILYWVLQGAHGEALKQLAIEGGSARRVRAVIEYMLANYERSIRIEELAKLANMGVSSLHRQFKAVTAMSPIQFQKQLRLQEARRLLLADPMDIAGAALRVGYESQSQFSREYARLFGRPPRADIRRLREPADQEESEDMRTGD